MAIALVSEMTILPISLPANLLNASLIIFKVLRSLMCRVILNLNKAMFFKYWILNEKLDSA